jgi:uncharacterized protein (TIGR03437 family)
MESKRLFPRPWRCLLAGGAIRLTCLLLAAWCLHGQPAPGSIATHSLPTFPEEGVAVIDARQNVYIAGGGGCAGGFGPPGSPFTCAPMDIAKVDATGSVIFEFQDSTPEISPRNLAVDAAGEVFVVGNILATGGFAAKLSADGSKFLYMTNLPAALPTPEAIQVDTQGNAYIAGVTADSHPFVTKLSADGSTFLYTVKLTGSGASSTTPDVANALAVDSLGDAVVTGTTNSSDFPVTPGVQSKLAGTTNAFVTKLDPSGNLVFSTFLGGTGGAWGQAIQTDAAGNIYVAGVAGTGFPTTPGTYEPVAAIPLWSEGTVGFAAKLRPDASAITWATYTVSNGITPNALYPVTDPIELAVSGTGDVYIATGVGAGLVGSASAPLQCSGAGDGFVLHLNAQGALGDATYLGDSEASPFGLGLPGDGSVLVAAVRVNAAAQVVPVLAQVVFGQAGWSAPPCLSPYVVNSANFAAGASPGEFVSLTGFGIGPETGVVYQPGEQGQAPLTLGGVSVTFNGIPAPLIYVQSRQVNAQVPFEVAANADASMVLTYGDTTFGPYSVEVDNLAEGIFRLQPGSSTQAAALNQDGSLNGPSNPAAPGSLVSVFGTGFGPLVPNCGTGGLNPPVAVPLYYGNPLSTVANQIGTALDVPYSGSAPTLLCGVAQFNMQVPLNAPSGPFLVAPSNNLGYGSTIYVQ